MERSKRERSRDLRCSSLKTRDNADIRDSGKSVREGEGEMGGLKVPFDKRIVWRDEDLDNSRIQRSDSNFFSPNSSYKSSIYASMLSIDTGPLL